MHRDWFIEGANVFVELYTDRVEVVSPSSLPKGMTLADLGTKSVRRNMLIATGSTSSRRRGLASYASGTRHGKGAIRSRTEANGFVTTIFRPNPQVRASAQAQTAEGVTRQVGTKSRSSRSVGLANP